MMIGPEAYYASELEGKSAVEIMKCIRSLKKEINRLKNVMEHPEYSTKEIMHPSEDVQLWCTRLYLERAKQALADAGGEYKPTKAELKAQDFQDNIPAINKIVFTIGGYFTGREVWTLLLEEDKVRLLQGHSIRRMMDEKDVEVICQLDKEDLLEGLEKLYIGEWLSDYSPERFNYYVCDGTQWDLEIYFSNGHRAVKKYGSNSYPYNFREFCELIGYEIDDDMDFEEE